MSPLPAAPLPSAPLPPATVEPWWRTPWVALPILAGAAGLGVAAAAIRHRHQQGRSPEVGATIPAWCPVADLGDKGGQLEGVNYIELRTKGAPPDARLPMVIALHSHGMTAERMGAFAANVPAPVRIIAPEGFHKSGLGRSWTELKPDDPAYSSELQDAAASLVPFIEAIQACRPTVGEAIVAGYSGGADLAFALAAEAADSVGAAVGAAGWVPPGVGAFQSPVVAIHGRDDQAVPYERTAIEMAARVGRGESVELVPLEGVGHSFAGALQLRWLEAVGTELPTT